MATAKTSSAPLGFTFGVYQLDPGTGELRKFGRRIRIQPQPFKLLVLLVGRAGEVVTRDEIQKELWGTDTFVDFERGLNHCVRQIRAILGEDASAPRYIETIPRQGYRFIAPVTRGLTATAVKLPVVVQEPHPEVPESLEPASPRSAPRKSWLAVVIVALLIISLAVAALEFLQFRRKTKAATASSRIMLAVLPFENLTGDAQQDYLSDGVTDELIVNLGKLSSTSIGIIARTSSMKYKGTLKGVDQISRELNVGYVLEGSIKRDGSRLHVTAQLIEAKQQTHLWANTYDGEISGRNLLKFQKDVASHVAQSLSLMLPEAHALQPSSANPAAYEAYLKGRYYWNKRTAEGFSQALEYFKQSIAADPSFAAPYVGIADCQNLRLEYFEQGSTVELAREARDAAQKALSLDSNSPDAHSSLAFNLWRYEWKFGEAEAEFKKALELGPNSARAHHWYGLFLASRSRFDEARRELATAESLDPLSLIVVTNLGWIDYMTRDYDSAISHFHEALALDPAFPSAKFKLIWAFEQKGMWLEALRVRQDYYRAVGATQVADGMGAAYEKSGYPGVLNVLLSEAAKPERRRYYDEWDIAKLRVLLGDNAGALDALKTAEFNHSGWLVFLDVEPAFDPLRGDPQFTAIAARVGAK